DTIAGINGSWTATFVDSTHVDLQSSTAATWSGNGIIVPVFTVTGAVTDGGLIRLTTSQPHGMSTGQQVLVEGVGGMPYATGVWLVTVIDSTHVDLVGSQFLGG